MRKTKWVFTVAVAVLCCALAVGCGGKSDDSGPSGDITPSHVHEYTESVTPPTCTEKGYTLYTCSCGDSYKDDYTDATGHSYKKYVANNDAACTADGTETAVCENCSQKETRTVEGTKLGHDVREFTHDDGAHYGVCERCGENTSGKHVWENRSCTVCGLSVDYTVGMEYREVSESGAVVGYAVSGIGEATDTDIVVPSEHSGKPVTAVDRSAFEGSDITSVSIPASIASIGLWAFEDCKNLTAVYYSGSLAEWCGIEFADGKSNPLYYAGDLYIDEVCVTTGKLVVPSVVDKIGDFAFGGCVGMTELEIPNGITGVGESAFSNCTGLKTASIANSVTEIGRHIFFGCTALTEVTLSSELDSIPNGAFKGCRELASVNIPSGVSYIGMDAFNACKKLTSVTVPSGVTQIGSDAFGFCSELKTVYWNAVACDNGDYGKEYFPGCRALTELIIADGVKTIPRCAFGNTGLKEVVIPDCVTEICDYAFNGCEELTKVKLPDGLETLNVGVFSGCVGLKQIELPAAITEIRSMAFNNSGLTGITLPSGLTYIANDLFALCGDLARIVIPSGVTEIEFNAFSDCKSLTDVTIPESVTVIGDYAFKGCGFTHITLPDGLTEIGEHAFSESAITEIRLPSKITEIKMRTFAGCKSLKTIIVPAAVTKIGYDAFNVCTSLTGIFFEGTQEQWNGIETVDESSAFTAAVKYFYSLSEPSLNAAGTAYAGDFWHFADDVPTVWTYVKQNG